MSGTSGYNKLSSTRPVPRSRYRRAQDRLLSLEEILVLIPPAGSSWLGLQNIPSARIVGSENRSSDFGQDFLPLHRRMDPRWRTIRDLMAAGSLNEPIVVLEFGGLYFVRDGNHRSSVARHEGMEFILADVTHLHTPLRFPPTLSRRSLPLMVAAWKLHLRAGIFDHLDPLAFDVRLPDTWDRLATHIERGHRPWMRRKSGRDPGPAELFQDWYQENYLVNAAEIESRDLLTLFPGWGITDVYVSLMDYWSTHQGWLSEVWRDFRHHSMGRSPGLRLLRGLSSLVQSWNRDPGAERERFLRMSNLLACEPQAQVPEGNASWYRFLLDQLMDAHALWYLSRHDEPPTLRELSSHWYRELLHPAWELWRQSGTREPFPRVYRAWMRLWRRELCQGRDPGLEGSLRLLLGGGSRSS